MKLSNRGLRRSSSPSLSMTSMIDVVFLLLIFFLVTTTFLRPEKQIATAIRPVEENSASRASDLEPAIVDVMMRGEQVMFRIGAILTNDIEEIEKVLASFDNKSEGAFVRVSDEVPFDAAAKAIGACRANGFNAVSYVPQR